MRIVDFGFSGIEFFKKIRTLIFCDMENLNKKYKKCFLSVILSGIIILLFSGLYGCKSDNTSDNKNSLDTTKAIIKPKSDSLNKKIGIEITGKDFQHGDPKDPTDVKDYNVIIYKLTNNTPKNLRQIDADVTITDLSGNTIKDVKIAFIEGISAGGSKEYRGLYHFNAFNEKDAAFKSQQLKNLMFVTNIMRIEYQDGTTELGTNLK